MHLSDDPRIRTILASVARVQKEFHRHSFHVLNLAQRGVHGMSSCLEMFGLPMATRGSTGPRSHGKWSLRGRATLQQRALPPRPGASVTVEPPACGHSLQAWRLLPAPRPPCPDTPASGAAGATAAGGDAASPCHATPMLLTAITRYRFVRAGAMHERHHKAAQQPLFW
jgi:hypothetical protein